MREEDWKIEKHIEVHVTPENITVLHSMYLPLLVVFENINHEPCEMHMSFPHIVVKEKFDTKSILFRYGLWYMCMLAFWNWIQL